MLHNQENELCYLASIYHTHDRDFTKTKKEKKKNKHKWNFRK